MTAVRGAFEKGDGLPRPKRLFPAIHDASTTNATALPADPTVVEGVVYRNTNASNTSI